MAITHVCLSDLHLGSETSLLTEMDSNFDPQYAETSPVLQRLAANLRSVVASESREAGSKRPTLVLAGDVLELALCETHQAATCFERFLDAFFPKGEDLFDARILYIPGNHDHQLWEAAREDHYTQFIDTQKKDPASPLTEE